MLLIIIKILTTFPLPGDRDYYEGFAEYIHPMKEEVFCGRIYN